MNVYTLNPLSDPRWAELIQRHPSASVFHSVPWLKAIQQTYGYVPVVYTTSAPSAALTNGVVFCQIKSWLTGRRMVSLPFSDHCDPLIDDADAQAAIMAALTKDLKTKNLKHIEIRPMKISAIPEGAIAMPACFLHLLDLRPKLEDLLRQTHKSCIQRPIKRAENDDIIYESGNSDRLLNSFYRLMIQTRRRHQLPPQPIQWFRNLASCMGDSLKIRVAFKDGREIASILTLQFKDSIVYKYGCSDSEFHNLGGMPLLFWKTISEAKLADLTVMDFGRSDADNPGLITFKDRWGAQSSQMVYLRWTGKKQEEDLVRGKSSQTIKRIFSVMPDFVLEATGWLLYRHIG